MRPFVLSVSLAHLLLLPAYVKLGAINPWQSVNSLFGGGSLWLVLMASAITAPFLLGVLFWGIDTVLKRWSNLWERRVRGSILIVFAILSICSLTNAILLADRTVDQHYRGTLVSFANQHLILVTTVALLAGLTCFLTAFFHGPIRRRAVQLLNSFILILSPATLFSICGVLYIVVAATPLEHSDNDGAGIKPVSASGNVPRNVVVLLFDGLSYDQVFKEDEVDIRFPNFRALAQQSLVFHNVKSFSPYTMDNVPSMLTGQRYDSIKLDNQKREVGHTSGGKSFVLQDQRNIFDLASEQGYDVVTFGYFLRYCSTYVENTGYCQSTSADELNSDPQNFAQAFLEIYRLAIAKTLPTSVGYKIESILGNTFLSLIENRVVESHDALLSTLKDAEGRFVYWHYPVPHSPYLRIDPNEGRLLASGATYFHSLQVVDYFLGDVYKTLREAETWDSSLIIIVSDHNDPSATKDSRVPLIVKLPHSRQHLNFHDPWTHIQFLPLLEKLLQSQSLDNESVATVLQELKPAQ